MYTSTLRKVGGSVMLAVPPAILDMLRLQSGEAVSMAVESGRLIMEATSKKRYSLQELLAQCDPGASMSEEDNLWASSAPKGMELL